jgi:hypothetical protein
MLMDYAWWQLDPSLYSEDDENRVSGVFWGEMAVGSLTKVVRADVMEEAAPGMTTGTSAPACIVHRLSFC